MAETMNSKEYTEVLKMKIRELGVELQQSRNENARLLRDHKREVESLKKDFIRAYDELNTRALKLAHGYESLLEDEEGSDKAAMYRKEYSERYLSALRSRGNGAVEETLDRHSESLGREAANANSELLVIALVMGDILRFLVITLPMMILKGIIIVAKAVYKTIAVLYTASFRTFNKSTKVLKTLLKNLQKVRKGKKSPSTEKAACETTVYLPAVVVSFKDEISSVGPDGEINHPFVD